MKITITGSLGNIGKPLTTELVRKGHDVTVITSKPQRGKEIESLGASPIVGELNDLSLVAAAFKRAEAVYCMIPPDFSQADQQEYYRTIGNVYAKAITETNVRRVVHLSSYGAHLPSGTGFIAGSNITEQIFNQLTRINVTHIRPTYFYNNLLSFIGMIKAAGFIGTVYGGDDKIAMVSPLDIASAIAEEIQKVDDTAPIRYVSSDERTCSEVAKVLGRAINLPELKWLTLPREQVMKGLLDHGVPENPAKNLVELGEALHNGRLLEDYRKNKPAPGKVKLEDFALEFARIFASK